jgi:phosphocarrier protein HPr
MVTKELTVINESGIHARPAALIVETCTKYKSMVWFMKDGMRANAKSIMNIMLLAAEYGAQIQVEADGPDEIEALAAIDELFQSKFRYE